MMTHTDPNAVRQELAAKVRDGIRAKGTIQDTPDETARLCEEQLAKAFIKARLCPKDMNFNQKRIVMEYAALVASELHAA
jgi:hypothetical protein